MSPQASAQFAPHNAQPVNNPTKNESCHSGPWTAPPVVAKKKRLRHAYEYMHVNRKGYDTTEKILRKARECELATLDGKSTNSGIAEPYAR